MNVRVMESRDVRGVEQMHEDMGLDYQMIDLESVPAKAICEHDGKMVGAIALKLQAETYLWLEKSASPREKWDAIRMLQKEIVRQAVRIGIGQLVAYVPDCVGCLFAKRMKMLKWMQARDGWRAWTLELGAKDAFRR